MPLKNSKKILVVEDERPLAAALTDKLAISGYKVINAYNGKEGLKLAIKEKPDLIILDIILPVMDGFTMLKKIRENKKTTDTPVIILTNLVGGKLGTEIINLSEVSDYLIKTDWPLKDVVKAVKKYEK